MRTVNTDRAPAAIGPYSQATIIGGLVYTSGQLPIDPKTGTMPKGIEAQAEQCFKNVASLLEAAGSDIGKTVKTTLYIRNMDDFAVINGVYGLYFTLPYPARSCVEVSRLPKGALIECEVIAKY